ncbi:MAG: helix-turn-helix domain-containing protein [Magnetococcales bacterium]|nr:helix-turn-helix domain-containing protein [Magnetococcales bacterium]
MKRSLSPDVANLALTVEEAAQALGKLSRSTVESLMRTEGLPHVRIGKRVILPVDGLKEWLRKRTLNGGRVEEKVSPCPISAKTVRSGMPRSLTQQAVVLDALLEPQTARKPKR